MEGNFKDRYIQSIKNNAYFIRDNLIYIIWFGISLAIVNIYIGIDPRLTACLSIGITLFASSPTGDTIYKWAKGIRKVETKKDKEYLCPIFDEVCSQIKENGTELPNIRTCIQ